jgi:hypothetical protein
VVAKATTNTDGYYYIDHDLTGQPLAAGDYLLKETAPGYMTTGASFNTMFNSATVNADHTINVHVVDLADQQITMTFGVGSDAQTATVYGPDFGQTCYSGNYQMSITTTGSDGASTTTTYQINCVDPYHDIYIGQSYQFQVSLQTADNNPAADGALGEIGWLANHYSGSNAPQIDTANISPAAQSSGLQLAIWALLKDGPSNLEASIHSGAGGVADSTMSFYVGAASDPAAINAANQFILMASGKYEHAYFLNSTVDAQGQVVGNFQGQVAGQGQVVFGDDFNFQNDVAPTGPQLVQGTTATIGYWANKNGQALLQSYKTTDIGNFLAATCPKLFGNLNGATGTQVAAYVLKAKAASSGVMNDYAQTLSTAIGVWVTGAGFNAAASAQHFVQQNGIGTAGCLYNVGKNGAAFGVANGTTMTILDMLKDYDSLCVATGGTMTSLPTSLKHTAGGLDAGGSTFATINNTGDIA